MTAITALGVRGAHVASVFNTFDSPSPPPESPSGTKTVLIVDDIWIARRTAARYLTNAGYRVYEADSAAEALEVLRNLGGRIDLVLTDVVMSNFNGVDFARRLWAEWPGTRVLFMSAYSALVLDQYGMDMGMPFVEKPFSEEGLIFKVAEVLGGSQETDVPTRTPRAS